MAVYILYKICGLQCEYIADKQNKIKKMPVKLNILRVQTLSTRRWNRFSNALPHIHPNSNILIRTRALYFRTNADHNIFQALPQTSCTSITNGKIKQTVLYKYCTYIVCTEHGKIYTDKATITVTISVFSWKIRTF